MKVIIIMEKNQKIKNMEQFAEAVGLSRPTVSRYFNNSESVRPSTRKLIEEALQRFDYHPNIYAINQNRKLTKSIGIVVPYLSDPYCAEIARSIETKCLEAGYSPSLFSSNGSPHREQEVFDVLRSMKPSGVLLAPLGSASHQESVSTFCNDVPTVLFDSNIEGLGRAFVGSDNAQFTKLMVNYLCRFGSPPVFLDMKTPPNPNARRRSQSYIDTMVELGFEPRVEKIDGIGWELEEIGYKGGLKLLSSNNLDFDTVLCSNDRLAIGFLAACHEKKLSVGLGENADIRVAGQDDHPFSRYTFPPLTTVAQDYDAVSNCAVNTLLGIVNSEIKNSPRSDSFFEGKLIMRSSA